VIALQRKTVHYPTRHCETVTNTLIVKKYVACTYTQIYFITPSSPLLQMILSGASNAFGSSLADDQLLLRRRRPQEQHRPFLADVDEAAAVAG